MLEKYRVFGAMIALKQFTVADLARFSGVKGTTVQTVLDRYPYAQKVEKKPTGRPGGAPWIYALDHTKQEEIEAVLDKAHGSISPTLSSDVSPDATDEVPLGFLTARDILYNDFNTASDSEQKLHLFTLAEIEYKGACAETTSRTKSFLAHRTLVESLLLVRKAELQLISTHGRIKDIAKLIKDTRKITFSTISALISAGYTKSARDFYRNTLHSPAVSSTMPSDVFVLDCIDDGVDTITPWVLHVLHEHDIKCHRTIIGSNTPSQNVSQSLSPATAFLLTVDSDHDDFSSIDDYVRSYVSNARHTIVLDETYSTRLRNEVSAYRGHYLSRTGLNEAGLLGALGFRGFVTSDRKELAHPI